MQTKYFLRIRQSDVVGPHTLDNLREWVSIGAIPCSTQVCKAGEQQWMSLSEIPKIDFITVNVQKRLVNRAARKGKSWYSEPATAKQLVKLEYFGIPFEANSLTKGHASELIDCFTAIDPAREEQYEDRPATPDQIESLRVLGEKEDELTYSEAKELIAERESEAEQHIFEHDSDFMILGNMLNDGDVLEICHYRELSDSQLQEMLDCLNRELPDWKNRSRFDLGKLVPRVFPELCERNPIPKKGGFSLALLVVLAACAAFAIYKFTHPADSSTNKAEAIPTPEQASPVTVPVLGLTPLATITPAPTPALTVEEWKKKAIEQYPQLAVAGSPFNALFVAKYNMHQGTSYFDSPDWPMRLAKECAESVQGK